MKDLLLQLCQYPFDPSKKDYLKELLNHVQDWNRTVELINAHGIIALAAYNIREAGLEKVIPPFAMNAIDNGYHQNMVRNLWLKERWKEVNEILINAGIKHILLKGMALEYSLYDAKGLRQMSDTDILIRREEAPEAWHLLQQSGFQPKTIKSILHKNILPDIGKHLPPLFKEGYAIEIHTRLFDSESERDTAYQKLFDDAVEITIDGKKALILRADIHLKYLIRHFEKHALEGDCQIRLYADIILLDKNRTFIFPEKYVLNPSQGNTPAFRKAAYKANVLAIPVKKRFRFILGDLFPSLRWMKERYKSTGLKVLFYYPLRLAKLWWLK